MRSQVSTPAPVRCTGSFVWVVVVCGYAFYFSTLHTSKEAAAGRRDVPHYYKIGRGLRAGGHVPCTEHLQWNTDVDVRQIDIRWGLENGRMIPP